ncbi:tyrosine-type recombinase/integrase [Chloroflexota bacterium]
MTGKYLDIKKLIEGFRISCQTENKSPKTVELYTGFLTRFSSFLQSNNCPVNVAELNRNHIRSFILYLQQEAKTPRTKRPLSPSTVQGYTRTLKVFFGWLLREEYIDSNPMTRIPLPRSSTKLISTFSAEQIDRLVSLCHASNGSGFRNLTIILLLLDAGISLLYSI